MVEGARLESVYTGNRIEGSNPSLSASQANRPERAVLVWWDEGNLFPKGTPNQKGRHSRRFAGVMLGPPSGMSERSEDNPPSSQRPQKPLTTAMARTISP